MSPSLMDYPHSQNESNENYNHKKFNTGYYKHKKFGQRITKDEKPTAPILFRPYALNANTPRKRRQESEQRPQKSQQQKLVQHQLPPTPPTTPPQQQQQQQPRQQQQQQQQQRQQLVHQHQLFIPTGHTPAPFINHQAYAYVLEKQRAVVQIRQMLSINPDANTWPAELRNALYSILQQ